MFKTYVGATEDESRVTYLRPETEQAILVQFNNVLDVSRKKLPFGIAQIGKAFRNEINPRNFTFRSREFEHFFFQAEDGIRDHCVTGVQTCALPISDATQRGETNEYRTGRG